MNITVNKIKDNITGSISSFESSKKYSVPFNAEVFKKLQDFEEALGNAQTVDEAKTIMNEASEYVDNMNAGKSTIERIIPYLVLNKASGTYHLTQNGATSSVAIPKIFVDKVLKAHEEQLPIEPFVKTWIWFLRNPNLNPLKAENFVKYITTEVVDYDEVDKLIEEGYSDEVATQMSTYNDVSITRNGLLSTYKYVTVKNWKYDDQGEQIERYKKSLVDQETGEMKVEYPDISEDWYLIPPMMRESGDACIVTGEEKLTHRVKVGAVHSLPDWSYVNCNDVISCVKGLHLGGLNYIKGYGGKTSLLLNCYVNPMHIGAIPFGASDGAIRCLEYFVHSANFAPNKSMYHESDYAKQTEAQWADIREQAIKNSEAKIDKIKAKQEELKAF